jgi:hypothetical protein
MRTCLSVDQLNTEDISQEQDGLVFGVVDLGDGNVAVDATNGFECSCRI